MPTNYVITIFCYSVTHKIGARFMRGLSADNKTGISSLRVRLRLVKPIEPFLNVLIKISTAINK